MATPAQVIDTSYQVEVEEEWLRKLKDEVLAPIIEETINHPFIIGAESGTLPKHKVLRYFSDIHWATTSAPEFVSALAARGPRHDHQLKERLLENAHEECSHPFILWRMIDALGGDGKAIYDGPEWLSYDYSQEALDLRLAINCYCRSEPFAVGFAAMAVGVECGAPRIYGRMADTLIEHYGLSEEDVEWLRIHTGEIEIEHGNTGLRALGEFVDEADLDTQAACAAGVRTIARGMGVRLMSAAMAP